MGEQAAVPATSDSSDAQRKFLFATCFVALVATSFAFVMRAFLAADWQMDFGLSETQKGEILGAGLWPFGLSIVLFSLFIDRVGYGKSMIFALVCHVISVFLLFYGGGYWPLYFGSFLCGLAAGVVEAATNPAITSVYPKQKVKMLTIFHAGWPAGIVLNGIFLLLLGEQGLNVHWRFLVFLLLIPVVAYGIMLLKAKWPVSERVAAGVSYKDMLSEAGALGWLIVIYMVGSELSRLVGLKPLWDTTFIDVPSWPFLALIVVTTGLYYWYTRSLGRWMYVFLLFVMVLLAITELGTDNWIKELMAPAMGRIGLSGGWLLVYSAGIMMVLRLVIGRVEKILGHPLRALLISAVLATVGIFCLSWAEGAWILLFATIYGMGQCYFWPMTLGLVAERFPRGGALTLNAVAGVGMLGVGILGSQFLGFWQDRGIDGSLQERDRSAYERLMSPEEKTSIFGDYKSLDQGKVNAANDKTAVREFIERELSRKLAENVEYQALVKDAHERLVREEGDTAAYSHEDMQGALEGKGLLIKDKALSEYRRAAAEADGLAPGSPGLGEKLAEDAKYQVLVRNTYNHLARKEGDLKAYSYEEMHKALEEAGAFVGDVEYVALSEDRKLVGEITGQAKKNAMARVASLPAIQALCYIGLIIYFRKKLGGYKAVDIAAEGGAA